MRVFKIPGEGFSHTYFAIKCQGDEKWKVIHRYPKGDGSFIQEYVATPAVIDCHDWGDGDVVALANKVYRSSTIDCETGEMVKGDMDRLCDLKDLGIWVWDCRFFATGKHDYWKGKGYKSLCP